MGISSEVQEAVVHLKLFATMRCTNTHLLNFTDFTRQTQFLSRRSLSAYLTDSSLSLSSFKRHLKTFLFSFY